MSVTVNAPAKINIFLDILGKLENGYHSLFMIMQSVKLNDILTVSKTKKDIVVICNIDSIPTNEQNTVFKAAKYFFDYCNIDGGAEIKIEKNIPCEAGLAGGSSDAAATLRALNQLYDTNLSLQDLIKLSLKVGSDVPFCMEGGTQLAQNTGGILSKLPPIDCYVVLVKPEISVSTKKAYDLADINHIYHPDCIGMLDACEKGDFDNICKLAGNVFEQFIEVPERVEIKKIMRECGCSLAQMSGSGPTIFGLFKKESDAKKAYETLLTEFKSVFLTKTI